ncbi:MAG: anti-sigma factor family protein [Actinomycetota bacterium]
MTHPEELLAGYVDGTLSAEQRAAVDAHVAGCARCSWETALAAGARSALRSLPELPAPSDAATRALEEAGAARRSAGDGGTPRWYRVGGIVAAAAAGLLVLTLVLPHIGQSEGSGSDAARGKAPGAERDSGPVALSAAAEIEIRHVNYDDASLTELASSYRSDTSGGGGIGAAEASPAPAFGSQTQTGKAIACAARSAPDETGDLRGLIRARFEGTPAYLAVFLEGPGASQPADAVTVWVFAIEDCRILSFSSAQL